MRNTSIEIEIEELVVDGYSDNDGDRIARGLKQELGRLLADQNGAPWTNPTTLGEAVAGIVHRKLMMQAGVRPGPPQ